MCTFYNNQNSIHTEPLLQHRLPAPVVLVPALLEQKRVVQVMSRRAGNGAKRRVPRVARRGGRGVIAVAFQVHRARVTRLLGRGCRRRRAREWYARERRGDTGCVRDYLRRSRWPRRRRCGGCLLGGRRAAAKHGPCGVGSEAAVLPPAMGPGDAERCAKLFLYVRSLQGQW